jgi:SpoVK/Ycf46/Vps4 family AAA+-type ATPase
MSEDKLIPFDRMKEQIEKQAAAIIGSAPSGVDIAAPSVSFEKGVTAVSFPLPDMGLAFVFDALAIIKKHISNVRIHSFDTGYYAFQAMNENLFKSEGMLDNLKVELIWLSSTSRADISKKGSLSQEEINLAVELFRRAYASASDDPVLRLKKYGASIYTENSGVDWDYIAGYEEVKRKIKESVILPLQNPELFDSIAKMTRRVFESNRPRAVLFEGPPGVGKTTAARVIAAEAGTPLVYVPIESIMSKWYGQSSQNLSGIFDACDDMGGAIIFLDEIDSLAGSRDQNMFEATRRVLSVLLRKIDGIDSSSSVITIGATNRVNDLDAALISRFDQIIRFPLPNAAERGSIFANYARHLTADECAVMAERTEDLSGRNIKDLCEYAERRWARRLILKKLDPSPPEFEYYKQSVRLWQNG